MHEEAEVGMDEEWWGLRQTGETPLSKEHRSESAPASDCLAGMQTQCYIKEVVGSLSFKCQLNNLVKDNMAPTVFLRCCVR